jgi:hypothetical protein
MNLAHTFPPSFRKINPNVILLSVLRRIFEFKWKEVTESWRRLHNEELHNLYASPNIVRVIVSRRMTLTGHVARIGKIRNSCRIFVGKPEGKGNTRSQQLI